MIAMIRQEIFAKSTLKNNAESVMNKTLFHFSKNAEEGNDDPFF
jgi:hypothetical protein